MDNRNLDLAAEFCKLVGKTHLLAYLGLPDDASPEAAQKKFKARRKYMQGMQSNPKYKTEAIFLIKNFGALSKVLESPIPYIKDANRRAESQHLPVLEMTIKGVLAGGSLTHEQEDYLRRNAVELGVSEATFEDVLARLCADAGVDRASAAITISPEELKNVDFYHLLSVPRHASRDEIYAQYRGRKEECKTITDPKQRESLRTKVEKAWKVLSDEASRQQYDLSWTRTGPPARAREVARPVQVSTAPPIRLRDADPGQAPITAPSLTPARLEILSEPRQKVPISEALVNISIEVRNAGEMPLRGTVRSDVPWLSVLTTSLAPELKRQPVKVQIDPGLVEGRSATGTITLVSENGDATTVTFVAVRKNPKAMLYVAAGGGVALLLLLLVVVGIWLNGASEYTIEIDPWAEEVLIDGKVVGHGGLVVLDDPPLGEATLTVRHPNFKPWVKDVVIEAGGRMKVDLDRSAPMDFEPTGSLRRANLDQRIAGSVMSEFQPRLDACLRAGLTDDKGLEGVLRIHVSTTGYTNGIEVKGDGARSPAILRCLKRQAAGPIFPALKDGDFATVRYDYHINPR